METTSIQGVCSHVSKVTKSHLENKLSNRFANTQRVYEHIKSLKAFVQHDKAMPDVIRNTVQKACWEHNQRVEKSRTTRLGEALKRQLNK